jgi:hypothetical protein
MSDYSFFADLLNTFRLSPDVIKALIVLALVSWLALPCAVAAYFIRRYFEPEIPYSLVRSIHRVEGGFAYVTGGKSVESGTLIEGPQEVMAHARADAERVGEQRV